MIVVQGTTVRIKFTVFDPDTDRPVDPPDVRLTVKKPNGAISGQTYSAGAGGLTRLGVGVFEGMIDTSPMNGVYSYEVVSVGPNSVRLRRQLKVDPWIAA